MLDQTRKAWLCKTVQQPTMGGAALAALQLGYISNREWEELRALRTAAEGPYASRPELAEKQWRELRLMLACLVLLAENCELEV